MFFAPYVIRGSNAEKVLVQILPASPEDLTATKGTPSWQTDWESEYLSQPSVDKFALKLENGELLALGAYQISGRKAYVYILYVESAPQSNPTLTTSARREYYGIGEVMIAFGIKYSIDAGCRGDVVFDAKTDELARHYAKDFGAQSRSSAFRAVFTTLQHLEISPAWINSSGHLRGSLLSRIITSHLMIGSAHKRRISLCRGSMKRVHSA